jgi:hypothetical protein
MGIRLKADGLRADSFLNKNAPARAEAWGRQMLHATLL